MHSGRAAPKPAGESDKPFCFRCRREFSPGPRGRGGALREAGAGSSRLGRPSRKRHREQTSRAEFPGACQALPYYNKAVFITVS